MKWLSSYRMKLLLVGIVAAIVICGGNAKADFIFGEPMKLGPTVNNGAGGEPGVSADGLELYFSSLKSGGQGGDDIWVSRRVTINDDWGTPVNLGPTVNSSVSDRNPSISADGLELFFHSSRPGGFGDSDLYVATRTMTQDDWGEPVNLGFSVNTSSGDVAPSISADGLTLYFDSDRPGGYGGYDIWVTNRAAIGYPWAEPANLGPIVSIAQDCSESISANGLWLFFHSYMGSNGYGNCDLWVSKRATTSDLWAEPFNLGPTVNSSICEHDPSTSADGLTLYFERGSTLWQAPIIPIVDFNGDAIVDVKDVAILTDHWSESYSLCDIGPTPLGDGIVDVQDLEVLIEYIEPIDRTLIAHWALDEIEGDIAQDIAGENDAYIVGGPVWQPDGGKAGGALQFDGIDDYVSTPFVLNPGEVSFSVLVWIKSSAAGQFIISQVDSPEDPILGPGSNWLGTDKSGGRLMSGLMDAYFGPLESDLVVTDGQWHHVGLVYDLVPAHRYLYVDGVEVAADTDIVPVFSCDGGLYIGAGKDLEPDSFYSGLIDDVRIYRRALSAEQIAALAQ